MLTTLETTVKQEWIDYNGHLNDAYYLVIFTQATDKLQEHLGMTMTSIRERGHTLFTVESHLMYKQEVGLGEAVYINTQVLEHDSKRLRILHRMFNDQHESLACVEMLFLSYHLQEKRVMDFHPDFAVRLAELYAEHQQFPFPDEAGKGIALKPKS